MAYLLLDVSLSLLESSGEQSGQEIKVLGLDLRGPDLEELGGTGWGRRKNTNQTHSQKYQNFMLKIQIGKRHEVTHKFTTL